MAQRGRWRRSAWILLTLVPFGAGTWIAFAYAGMQARNRRWIVYAACYLAALVAGFVLVQPDDLERTGEKALWALWAVGFVHALLIRNRYLDRLDANPAWADEVEQPLTDRRFARVFALPALAALFVAFGITMLAAAAVTAVDARRLATAPRCSWPARERCIAETPATVTRTLALTYRDNDYLVNLTLANGAYRQVELLTDADLRRVRAGDRVRVRAYGDTDLALVLAGGDELRAKSHPEYAWAGRLAMGFTCVCFAGFGLWMLIATRGRMTVERMRRRRLGLAGPVFVLVGGAPLLYDIVADPRANTLGVVTLVCAFGVVLGALAVAALFRPPADERSSPT